MLISEFIQEEEISLNELAHIVGRILKRCKSDDDFITSNELLNDIVMLNSNIVDLINGVEKKTILEAYVVVQRNKLRISFQSLLKYALKKKWITDDLLYQLADV